MRNSPEIFAAKTGNTARLLSAHNSGNNSKYGQYVWVASAFSAYLFSPAAGMAGRYIYIFYRQISPRRSLFLTMGTVVSASRLCRYPLIFYAPGMPPGPPIRASIASMAADVSAIVAGIW